MCKFFYDNLPNFAEISNKLQNFYLKVDFLTMQASKYSLSLKYSKN